LVHLYYNLFMLIIVRESHILLIIRLIGIELITLISYLIIRLPKTLLISTNLEISDKLWLNYVAILYFIILSLIKLILIVKVTLEWANNIYEIREDSIIHHRGILKIKEDIYTLRNLSSVVIEQNIWGKLFNYGTIILYSPIHKSNYHLNNIHNPKKIVNTFYDNIEDKKTSEIIRKKL